jgi:DNA polymerase III delta subunit
MPAATPATVRRQIAKGAPDPVYLLIGDDDEEVSKLTAELSASVEDELRAFNVERLYASDKSVTSASIVESARLLPMMAQRRVVVVLRAERILKPKRRGKTADEPSPDNGEASADARRGDELEEYVRRPEPQTTLVLVASDADRTRRLYKALQKHATIVECWGLKRPGDKYVDLRQAARDAEQIVQREVRAQGQEIEPAAARLVAERAGTDIAQLRGDVARLVLFAAGKKKISVSDAQEVVSGETAQDDWAVTNAIQRGNVREALRQLALALEAGAVSYQVLGQLAYYVREKLPMSDPRRVRGAVEALFRTDLDLKSSGGDPRVLLERLVIELCGG